jgi:uncharacterized membrane protein
MTEADTALAVADDDERCEAEALTALHRLRDAVDVDELFDQLLTTVVLRTTATIVTATTVAVATATAAVVTAAARSATATAATRTTTLLLLVGCRLAGVLRLDRCLGRVDFIGHR